VNFADLDPFLAAILIGALIGTERQRRIAEDRIKGVAGLRTFTLIALLGALSANLSIQYGQSFAVAALVSFAVLVSIGYAASANVQGRVDFTAAVAAVLTFALGMLCDLENGISLAVALAVIVTWILATRALTHRYVEALSETDILDTLKMAIIALVIYPLLPDTPLDPYGVLNPREIWMMVVLVCLIGYVGYILIRILGTERGLSLTGVLGGLVSSTVVTMAMAEEVRVNKEVMSSAVFATVVASCTMFPRMLFIVLVVNRDLFLKLLPSLMAMTAIGLLLAYLFLKGDGAIQKDIQVKDPFRILPALEFGAFFAFVLLASKVTSLYFGDTGIYAASLVAGLADVDAITLSMATLAGNIAVRSIMLASMTNTVVKLVIAFLLGNREFGRRIAMIFLPTVAVSIAVALLLT
jgi:uncharacterized membrane protein (DUF4010 family)